MKISFSDKGIDEYWSIIKVSSLRNKKGFKVRGLKSLKPLNQYGIINKTGLSTQGRVIDDQE